MPTLGTQYINLSYPQLLKTFSTSPISGTIDSITTGDNTLTALSLSTSEVRSTGSLTVDGASKQTGAVTFGSHITASTGTATIGTASISTSTIGSSTISTASISTATIGTASISTATISTATISTATIPLHLGNSTFGSNVTMSTGTATIGTATISTASISTASIPLQLGNVTFGSNVTMSTGTATIGTATISTASISTATIGTLEIGVSGPNITKAIYATSAWTGATLGTAASQVYGTSGSFAVTGVVPTDIVIGSASLAFTGSYPIFSFSVAANDYVRYSVFNNTTTASATISSGTFSVTALRFTT